MKPLDLFAIFWVGFGISWLLAAMWRSPADVTLSSRMVWLYRLLVVVGGVLLNHAASVHLHASRLWHVGWTVAYVLAWLTLPGFAFACWARVHLGKLWSGSITRKADHRVIDTGPYAMVRHPIYTGILFACLVSAIAGGTWVSLAGFGLMTAGFWVKVREEETFLSDGLGPIGYEAYRARVPVLLPIPRLGR